MASKPTGRPKRAKRIKVVVEKVAGVLKQAGSFEKFGTVQAITLWMADPSWPTARNFADLMEEVRPAVFAGESPERQEMLKRAMASLSDDMIGGKVKLSEAYPPEQAGKVLQEERLMAARGRKFDAQGFTPPRARASLRPSCGH